jgi:hypothetical protein
MTDAKSSTRKSHPIPMIGREFGRLVVISQAVGSFRDPVWECLCRCGQATRGRGYELRSGMKRQCAGCLLDVPPPFPDDGEVYGLVPDFRGYAATQSGLVLTCLRRPGHSFADSWRPLRPVRAGDRHSVRVVLGRDRKSHPFYIHRVILMTFVGPCPPGMECCHRDDNYRNNRLDNLYWGTRAMNMADKIRNDKQARGSRMGCARLTEADIPIIRAMRRAGSLHREIGERFGVAAPTIRKILIGKSWTHVPDDIGVTP